MSITIRRKTHPLARERGRRKFFLGSKPPFFSELENTKKQRLQRPLEKVAGKRGGGEAAPII